MAVNNLHPLDDDAIQAQAAQEDSWLVVEAALTEATLSGPRRGRRPQDADDAMEATLTTHADALATLADADVREHKLS